MNKRNHKCSCGSGKKRKYCCNKEKKRLTTTYLKSNTPIDFSNAILPNGDLNRKEVNKHIENLQGTSSNITYYNKDNKDKDIYLPPLIQYNQKITKQITVEKGKEVPLNKYDYIAAVDTNEGTECGFILFKRESDEQHIWSHTYLAKFTPSKIISGEKQGWIFASNIINMIVNGNEKVLLISDHELNEINIINSNDRKITESFHLPQNITMMYASSERMDGLENKLMKWVDELPREFKKYKSFNSLSVYSDTNLGIYQCSGLTEEFTRILVKFVPENITNPTNKSK